MDQFLTLKGQKLDQFLTLQHIYICCEVINWSKFGFSKGYYLVQVRALNWSKVIFALCLQWFQAIFANSIIILCFFGVQSSGNFLEIAFFFKERVQNLYFSIFCVFSSILSLVLFSCLVFIFQISFFLSFFSRFMLCSFFNMNVFKFQNRQVKNTHFWPRGGLQQNGFCCKMRKVIVLFCLFLGELWLMFKKHYKNGISAHF